MSFLEALYGSQYYEISQSGRNGNRGKVNGNLFLTAMIILVIFALLMVAISFIPGFNEELARLFRKWFGRSSGKTIGRLLTIPLMIIIYLIVSTTVGTAANFKGHVEAFMQRPDEEKKKANAKLLVPFLLLLAIVIILAVIKL